MPKTRDGPTSQFYCTSTFQFSIIFLLVSICSTLAYLITSKHGRERSERPEEWVPEEVSCPLKEDSSEILQCDEVDSRTIVDIFSIHSGKKNYMF